MALIGVHDVAVSKFVPYPGSELFKRLQRENRIAFDDEFFLFPMDIYTQKAPSYSEHLTTAELYRTMLWMFVNFYVISFACRPLTHRASAVESGSDRHRRDALRQMVQRPAIRSPALARPGRAGRPRRSGGGRAGDREEGAPLRRSFVGASQPCLVCGR